MKEKLISVVVPIYNVEKYLRKCIESIINQTYKKLEIILVDDGSKDESGKICDEYAAVDERIKVIHKENGGLISARKAGLKITTGEFISNIDGDDWLESNMYEEMMKNILETGAEIVNTGVIYTYENGEKIREVYEANYQNCVVENPKKEEKIWRGFLYHYDDFFVNSYLWSKLFRKELFEECYKNLSDEANYGEDRIVITECLLKCKKISFLKKCFYHYIYKREGSYTSKRGAKGIIWAVRMYGEMYKLFEKYEMYEEMKKYLDAAIVTRTLMAINESEIYPEKIAIWKYGVEEELTGKKIIIYGASQTGYDYYRQLSKNPKIKIVKWVDKNYKKYKYPEREPESIEEIRKAEYDLIITAVTKEGMAEQIKEELKEMGVDEKKIKWSSPKQISYENLEARNGKIKRIDTDL